MKLLDMIKAMEPDAKPAPVEPVLPMPVLKPAHVEPCDWKCIPCDLTFASKIAYNSHMVNTHPLPVEPAKPKRKRTAKPVIKVDSFPPVPEQSYLRVEGDNHVHPFDEIIHSTGKATLFGHKGNEFWIPKRHASIRNDEVYFPLWLNFKIQKHQPFVKRNTL